MSFTQARSLAIADGIAATYNIINTALVASAARIATLRGVVDAYNEAKTFQGTIDGSIDAEAKNVIGDRASLLLADLLNGYDDDCAKYGEESSIASIKDAKSFAQYFQYGVGGPWGHFWAPDFALAFQDVFGAYPGAKLVYSPAVADMGHKASGGAFVAGTDVDTSLYAGAAIPKLLAAGLTGTGMATVVGNGYSSDGLPQQGRSWSVNVTGNGTFTLVPGVAGDILTKVTAINVPAGITAGTLTVQADIPAGRSNPPS